jgi:predicted transcriptional regulator
MNEPRRTVTLRLPVSRYRRLERAARAARRSLDRHVEDLIERELAIQDEAVDAIRMFVPSEAESLRHDPGELLRTPGESDERHAERQQVFATLLKLPIAG